MAIDATPSQVATSALQAIPFGSMIGGPLNACIEAQAMAAQTSWQFIQEVGLNTNPETGQKEAVNVSFQFVQNGRVVQLNVPLLTIVPIPYIARATQESKYSVEYTMDVAVKAGQESMPAGLAKVLELLGSSLDVCDPEGTLEVSARELSLKDGKAQLIATYKNSKGIFEPKAISVDGGASSTVSDNSVIIDFTSANKYTLKAGGKTLTVNVSAEAPSAKTAEK